MAIKPLSNEQAIIACVANDDEHAFALLFEGYSTQIAKFVFNITHSEETTEEIVQDIFVKIWISRHHMGGIKNFTNYLFILSRNHAISYLRKKASEEHKQQEWGKEQYDIPDWQEKDNVSNEYRELIHKAIDKLPAQQRKVFILSRYDRLKHEEIAYKLGISTETVKKHIQYATKAIKKFANDHQNIMIISILLSKIKF